LFFNDFLITPFIAQMVQTGWLLVYLQWHLESHHWIDPL